jgi:hypothetical protein
VIAVKILEDERPVLVAEIEGALGHLPPGPAREGYERLLADVGQGDLAERSVGWLERLVEVGLESGRIRSLHGAHAEMAAGRLFQRTPRGAALRETLAATNEALAALGGSQLQQVSFTLRAPGTYTLGLDTDRCRATLVIDRHGVHVHSLEVTG